MKILREDRKESNTAIHFKEAQNLLKKKRTILQNQLIKNNTNFKRLQHFPNVTVVLSKILKKFYDFYYAVS